MVQCYVRIKQKTPSIEHDFLFVANINVLTAFLWCHQLHAAFIVGQTIILPIIPQ